MATDPWADSWGDVPLVLDENELRSRWVGQIINGRFIGNRDRREVLMVEAIDSTFWLVWCDDERVISALAGRFVDVTRAVPPTPFRVYG